MSKKLVVTLVLLTVFSAGLASPAFAQSQGSGSNPGFFGMFAQFFSRVFGHDNQNTPNQSGQDQASLSGTPSAIPSGAVPSGQPDEQRLQGLVTAGKITQAQEQQILTEITKLRSEIQTWSQATGIDRGYIYAGLRGPMMNSGISGNGNPQPSETQGEQQGGFQGGPMHGKPQSGGMMQPHGEQR